jgi:hypothetical protein
MDGWVDGWVDGWMDGCERQVVGGAFKRRRCLVVRSLFVINPSHCLYSSVRFLLAVFRSSGSTYNLPAARARCGAMDIM